MQQRQNVAMMAMRIAEKALALLGEPVEFDRLPVFEHNAPEVPASKIPVKAFQSVIPPPPPQTQTQMRRPVEAADDSDDDQSDEDDDDRRAAEMVERTLEYMDGPEYSGPVVKRRKVDPKKSEDKAEEKRELEECMQHYAQRRPLTESERMCFLTAVERETEKQKKTISLMTEAKQIEKATKGVQGKFEAWGHISGVNFDENSRGRYTPKMAEYLHCVAAYFAEAGVDWKNLGVKQHGRCGTIANAVECFGNLLKEASPLARAFITAPKTRPADDEKSVEVENDMEDEKSVDVEDEMVVEEVKKSEHFDAMVKDIAAAVLFMRVNKKTKA